MLQEKYIRWMPAILWSAFVFYVSLLPGREVSQLQLNDKLAHVGVYALLGVSLFFPPVRHSFVKRAAIVIGYVFCMGLFIEYLQENYCENRHFDWMDVIANTFGGLLSIGLVYVWEKQKKSLLQ